MTKTNNRTKKILTSLLLPGLIGAFVIPNFVQVDTVVAATKEPLTLTYKKVNDTKGTIQVTLDSSVKSVLLPNGTTVTKNTSFEVGKNGDYDFVSYNSRGQPTQQRVSVSSLDVDSAPLTTSHGLYIKLHVDAFDTISEVDSYRYKLDNATSWSSWTKMKKDNSHEIKIPITTKEDSFIDDREVQLQVKDHAGNVEEKSTKFRVDHSYPEIEPYKKTIYTNKAQITVPLVLSSHFKIPEELTIKEGSTVTSYALPEIEHTSSMLERRPGKYKADWGSNITYKVGVKEGRRDLTISAIKHYEDFKGNAVQLSSSQLTNHVINVVHDSIAPDGKIKIKADENNEVPSHEVDLDLSFTDENSGVEKVRVFEGHKEYELTPNEIKAGKLTKPWTISLGKDAQVSMEVTDKAGNSKIFVSQKVTVSNIMVTGFELTDIVNPVVPFPTDGYQWQFDGNEVPMVAGGNISFNILYNLGEVNHDRFLVEGDYNITIVDEGKIVYQSDPIKYKQGFDESLSNDAGFMATYTIPNIDSESKPFRETAKIYISSKLKRTEKTSSKVMEATFENPNSQGNLIGTLGHYDGSSFMEDMIWFNEKN